jgi:hypothetical protein
MRCPFFVSLSSKTNQAPAIAKIAYIRRMSVYSKIGEYEDLDYLCEYTKNNVIDGIRALDSLENGWEGLKNHEVDLNEGFFFTTNPFIHTILAKMTVGHSGGSFADTMRHLHFIAKHGLAAHRLKIHWNSNWTTPPGPLNMYYSDGLANTTYDTFIHQMLDRDLETYGRLLPDKLRQVYPGEEHAETRAARLEVFDAAVRTRPHHRS